MNFTTSRFSTLYCEGEVIDISSNKNNHYDIVVKGTINDVVSSGKINFIAASPADRRGSYSGSGLPFHDTNQAFVETPNKGKLVLEANSFEIPLMFPNAYYVNLGNQLIPPTLFLSYENGSGEHKIINIKLSDPIPYRMLGYPAEFTMARQGAEFYHAHHNLPVRTQEQICRDSMYPNKNKMQNDFWGLRPAL